MFCPGSMNCNLLVKIFFAQYFFCILEIVSSKFWRPLWRNYGSPSSREACRDRQLTPNFEPLVEKFFVCRHVSNVRTPKPCLSVCPYTEKRKSPWLRQYQSYICNSYINGKVFTSYLLQYGSPKNLDFLFKNGRNWILTCTEELKSP